MRNRCCHKIYYGFGTATSSYSNKGINVTSSASATAESTINTEDANSIAEKIAQNVANSNAIHDWNIIYQSLLLSDGITGAQGSIGSQGSTGPKGDNTGYTGPQGSIGATGVTGYTGSQGSIGAQGATGVTGYTGAQGSIGVTGYTGPQGNTGPVALIYTNVNASISGITSATGPGFVFIGTATTCLINTQPVTLKANDFIWIPGNLVLSSTDNKSFTFYPST